jgi:hypothetical protein
MVLVYERNTKKYQYEVWKKINDNGDLDYICEVYNDDGNQDVLLATSLYEIKRKIKDHITIN